MHPAHERFKGFVSSDRRWSGSHGNFRSLSWITRQLHIGQDAEHDARIRDHDNGTGMNTPLTGCRSLESGDGGAPVVVPLDLGDDTVRHDVRLVEVHAAPFTRVRPFNVE